MRLTTKGRFAVTAMIDLGLYGVGAPTSLAGISERQKISLSYLEQLFGKLRRKNLVDSVRGPGGGYSLARTPDRISVAEIVRAVDESLEVCGDYANCKRDDCCMAHELWEKLNDKIYEYLDSVKLADLVAQQLQKIELVSLAKKQSGSDEPPKSLGDLG